MEGKNRGRQKGPILSGQGKGEAEAGESPPVRGWFVQRTDWFDVSLHDVSGILYRWGIIHSSFW